MIENVNFLHLFLGVDTMFVTNNIYLVGYKWAYGMDVSRNWFGIVMWFVV